MRNDRRKSLQPTAHRAKLCLNCQTSDSASFFRASSSNTTSTTTVSGIMLSDEGHSLTVVGHIDANELRLLFIDLNEPLTPEEFKLLMAKMDTDQSGAIGCCVLNRYRKLTTCRIRRICRNHD